MEMVKGFSIHIGVNEVQADYPFSLLSLEKAATNAQNLQKIFDSKGFETHLLAKNEAAQTTSFLKLLSSLHKKIRADDLLVITFCGHGVRLANRMDPTENRYDEYWAFHDRPLKDDELHTALGCFKPHQPRMIVLSDCCYAGGMYDHRRASFAKLLVNYTSFLENMLRKKSEEARFGIKTEGLPLLLIAAASEKEVIEANGTFFTETFIRQMTTQQHADYDAFFEALKNACTGKEMLNPEIWPPKTTPDFRRERPFLLSH